MIIDIIKGLSNNTTNVRQPSEECLPCKRKKIRDKARLEELKRKGGK